MRILHVSDLHAQATPSEDQRLLVEKFIEDIAQQDQERTVELVIFSGDCSYDGTAESLSAARRLLLDPLAATLPMRRIVLAPGNHDVDRSRINPINERGMQDLLVTREDVATLMSDEDTARDALRRLGAWREFHAEWYADSPPTAVPLGGAVHQLTIGEKTVGVAALNTAWRCSGDGDRQRLLVSEPQTRAALELIADTDIRFVVMHHPYEWLTGFDEAFTRSAIEQIRPFVFTGHDHITNPTGEASMRGAAIYCRAGCLYASHSYANSYTLLDLDVDQQTVRASIRRWWPGRESFGASEDLAAGGHVDLPWPSSARQLPVAALPTENVLEPLAALARDSSIVGVGTMSQSPVAGTVPELLIEPTFWPLPDEEARAAQELGEDLVIEPVNVVAALDASRITIISGAPLAGVTSSLLWLLDGHFRSIGSRVPRYIRIDERISTGRLDQALVPYHDLASADATSSPPTLIGVDDVLAGNQRAVGRLIRFIRQHPEAHFVIGCHNATQRALTEAFDAAELAVERVFLRPLRRRDLRALASRAYGSGSGQLVQKVLHVIDTQRLPRNALNMSALVAVAARESNLEEVNETGLLDSYVSLLLEDDSADDQENLGFDPRRREYLLELFALKLLEVGTSRLPRPEAEGFVLDFFQSVGWKTGSPGHLLGSLIRRRVLVQDDDGVGFRYRTLQDLFAAKAMLSNSTFAGQVCAAPLAFPDVIRHAAGLTRNRPDLLKAVGAAVRAAAADLTKGVNVEQFDLFEDRHGWSQVAELAEVRALLEQPPPTELSEEQLDEIDDGIARPAVDDQLPVTRTQPDELAGPLGTARVYGLLAAVLRNSELVDDVDLKAAELREVIHGWSLLAVMLGVEEDESNEMRGLLLPLIEGAEGGRQQMEVAERVVRLIMLIFLTVALETRVASRQIEAALLQVLNDEEFMSATAHALFATFLFSSLRFSGWAERIHRLSQQHGSHSMVRTLVRQWSFAQYRSEETGATTLRTLEEVLFDLSPPPQSGASGVLDRSQQRSEFLESLRRARLLTRQRADEEKRDEEDLLLDGESTDHDAE
jgi:3',5'-cyclic AMP phosphodiesterase CpdA